VKKPDRKGAAPRCRSRFRPWIFPTCVGGLYLILLATAPEHCQAALQFAGRILIQAALPLLLAFAMMFFLNRFITPAHVTRFMGRRAGIKGILLSSSAGIISMGPIFAWYTFLKALREKGAAEFHLANFLSNRAVKPVMLPLMITFFGWRFSLVFTLVSISGALVTAAVVSLSEGDL
jgi:uncharacterized membrane protein YraQ (UPF0718 family)